MGIKAITNRALLLAALVQAASGQTRIDLGRQTKNIDFRAAQSTHPAKSGIELPAACLEAEVFIKTDAPAGRNMYVCVANQWVSQSVDTQFLQTKEDNQSGRALLCESSSDSGTAYTCSMQPALTQYTTGMLLRWIPDAANSGPATLNVDGLGARPIRCSEGSASAPPGSVLPGLLYEIWYDGTTFRLPASGKITVEANGEAVGTRATVDFNGGEGITKVLADTGDKMTVQLEADTAYLLSKAEAQSGSVFLAIDSGDDDAYTPRMSPTLTAYKDGMFVLFRAATAATGASSMDIDTLGPTALKESDCSADASITANQFYLFAYNGTVFCKVGSRGGATWGAITGTLQEQPDLAAALAAKQNALGFTPENTAGKGQPDGYASLGADGKVPTEQLPPGGAAWGAITGALQEQPDLAAALAAKQNTLGFTPENTAGKGQPDGYASLGADGKVSSEQLPSGEARTYFRSPQTVRATAIAPTANDARLWAFYVDAPVRYSMILLPVIGVDTNPCADGANCYDIGIFDDAGNLVSNTGPMSITGSGGLRQFTFAQGERRMEIGWYHFAVTGSANAATFGGHATSQSVVYSKRVNASGGATSGGALPATVTMPAESWAFSSIPAFTLR